MKKRLRLIILLGIAICLLLVILCWKNRKVLFCVNENGELSLLLKYGEEVHMLSPYYDTGSDIYYFFLPAFANDKKIYNDEKCSLSINGDKITAYQGFSCDAKEVYSVEYMDETKNYIFMNSENLSAIFIDTESGTLDHIHQDKENEESGNIAIVASDGTIDCIGKLSRFSGRGNTTFYTTKKSYTFSLENSQTICGLKRGKKWNLLSLYFEGDKIHSKIAYDLAEYLGIQYAVGSNWVDLYCNGKYMGLYLLTEAVTVGEGRVEISDLQKDNEGINVKANLSETIIHKDNEYAFYDIASPKNITGGYLLEKSQFARVDAVDSFFSTDINQYYFIVKRPKYSSQEELMYIRDYIQNIENLIANDGEYWNYIDINSFAKQFLLDKIVMDNDAMWASTFYYKERDDALLKAGPVWDYDRAFGTILSDYSKALEDAPNSMSGWYSKFLQDEDFLEKMEKYYEESLIYLHWVYEEGIDQYVEHIAKSREMDAVLMQNTFYNETSCYDQYENYIRYLKFFISNRVNYLNDIFEVDQYDIPVDIGNGKRHVVKFWRDQQCIAEYIVFDGERIDIFPESVQGKSHSWRKGGNRGYKGKAWNAYMPIYEDIDLYEYIQDE